MRLSPILLLPLTISSLAFGQILERYPATNSTYLDGTAFKTSAEGNLVAVEGKVVRIANGPQGKPMYQLALTQSAEKSVWVANTMVDPESRVPVGATVRAFGYLQRVKDDDVWTKGVTADEQHILGLCFLNTGTQMAIYLRPAVKFCEDWQEGKTPEQIKR